MKNIKLRVPMASKKRAVIVAIFATAVLATAVSVSMRTWAAVGILKQVSFQGKVVNSNGTNVADASYSFRFRIYNHATNDATNSCSANSCLWEETKNVATVNGIFQTNLGSTVALPGSIDFNDDTLYLAVLFNGDTEMTPRIRLTAVPYAFNADKLGGLAASSFVQLSPGSQQTGFINVSGNITSGGIFQGTALDPATANALTIGGTNATSISIGKAAGGATTNIYGSALFRTPSGFDSSTAFQVQTSSNYNILNVDTSNGYVGISMGSTALSYALDINGDTGTGGNLIFKTGSQRIIQVASNSGGAGFDLNVQGGAAGSGNNNGGNVNLTGGTGFGTGARGVVLIDTAAWTTSTNDANCYTSGSLVASSCTISTTSVNNKGAILVGFSTTGQTATLPDPTNTTAGRIIYVTGANGSSDFALNLNSGGTLITIAMRQNSTATLIWNGSDWTAAGASSSTTLQAAYDNTLSSAAGAEIVLNNSATSNGLTIRNGSGANAVTGPVFEVQSSVGTELLAVNSFATEYASNGGAETSSTFGSNWTALGAGSVNRFTTTGNNVATGLASVEVNTPATINTGVRNVFASNLPSGATTYQVSFTGRLHPSSPAFSTLQVVYSQDGSSTTQTCSNYSTQTLVSTTWTKVTCSFTSTASSTSSLLIIRQTDATARTFYIDNLSVTLNDSTSTPANVQVGGGSYGGNVTLFTLDRSSSPPVAAGNTTLFGSMYYDTTSGRIQCYQSNGWGACGSAPDTYVSLNPEYSGAVLNGTGVGTMTADICSNQSSVLTVNTTLCSSGQSLNFYKWTSPQNTQQTYSIYVSFQLPGGFKNFQSDSTVQLTGRVDNTTNAVVTYQMFRSESGAVSACGTETTVTTSANTWQTVGINGNESSSCGFTTASANNYVIFKINMKANSNANAYVSTLSFTVTNQ